MNNPIENPAVTEAFISSFNELAAAASASVASKGFHDNSPEVGTRIALMHAELSEALEAVRRPELKSKLSGHTLLEEELADVILRIMDFAACEELDVGSAIVAKAAFNRGREHMHGGRKF